MNGYSVHKSWIGPCGGRRLNKSSQRPQNYDPEIHEEYLIHDTPFPLPHRLAMCRLLHMTYDIAYDIAYPSQGESGPYPESVTG